MKQQTKKTTKQKPNHSPDPQLSKETLQEGVSPQKTDITIESPKFERKKDVEEIINIEYPQNQSPQIDVVGKPMIPSTMKTSGKVTSLTGDTQSQKSPRERDVCSNGVCDKNVHSDTPRGKNKTLWILGGMFILIILMDVSFIAFSFSKKDFNSTVNVDNPVNVNPTNNYTIVNNQTTILNVDPEVMRNILGNISAIRIKLNMTNIS